MSDLLLNRLKNNPFVYHYTSLETLFAILEEYRHNKEAGELYLKASCIYNVNDLREMDLGFNVIKKHLPDFERNASINLHLSDVYNTKSDEKKCIEKWNTKPKDGMICQGMVPYVLSFSCTEDFLPMWSMYGNDKKGVCLKFNTLELADSVGDSGQYDFVSYDEEDSYIFNEHFLELYKYTAEHIATEELTIEEKIDELSLLCECVSPFIKSKDWAYEKEFRIIYRHKYGKDLNEDNYKELLFLHKKEQIKPYLFLLIKACSLDSIIIGPLSNFKSIEHIVLNELNECQLSNVKVLPSAIQIR